MKSYEVQDLILSRARRQGMHYCELAERIGVSQITVYRWRAHSRMISMKNAEKAIGVLNDALKE